MNSQKDKRVLRALILGACAGFVLWVALLALRATGHINMHWALVFTGFAWLTWLVYALMALTALFIHLGRRVWRRLCCVSCRELRANLDGNVWDKYAEVYGTVRQPGETDEQLRARIIKIITYNGRPQPLSGKWLDLRAWQDYQIRRKPGETDEELRARCMNEADNEMASGGIKLDELAREDYNVTRLPGESDEELRRRLHAMVDNKHADKPELSGDELDMRACAHFRIFRKPGETDEELLARMVNKPR